MLYEIKQEGETLQLFLSRKTGLKYKCKFNNSGGPVAPWVHHWAKSFADEYLRLSCLACKQRGWVYKTRVPPEHRSSIHGGRKWKLPENAITVCPECQTQHCLQYEEVPEIHEGREFMSTKPFLRLLS